MEENRIGKIRKIKFGRGGYQDAMIGVTFDLGSDKESWGVGDFWGFWAVERGTHAKWTEAERVASLGETVMRVNRLLNDAGVADVAQLVGKPVMVTFDTMTLSSWRLLTEAI